MIELSRLRRHLPSSGGALDPPLRLRIRAATLGADASRLPLFTLPGALADFLRHGDARAGAAWIRARCRVDSSAANEHPASACRTAPGARPLCAAVDHGAAVGRKSA